MERNELISLLDYINPAGLNYQEWLNVGMALHYEGIPADVWEQWSRRDGKRYHSGECSRKWEGFHGSPSPVTGATIVQLAKEGGWQPDFSSRGTELDWNDTIEKDDLVVIDKDWIEGKEFKIPEKWEPVKQLITYLETLFESTDKVGYTTRATKGDGGRIAPAKGCWDRTAGQLIEKLSACGGDIGAVLGDYNPEYGAWIRFNPLDGQGIGNANVTDFRFALVESDNVDLEKQNAIIRELELPVAALVYSGGKSLHAIVRIEAADAKQYRERVEYLYKVCDKNGFEVDRNNKNPSRLSRMPGVIRNGKKQYLLDTNIGKKSWSDWVEWIESVNDDLPDPENLADIWDDMPELSPPLIDGILRQGHKMLIAGPSKAGKSYALLELCCAIAEGKGWLGFNCAQGKVMYVNLELDRASCLHRLKDVYTRLGWKPENAHNIDMWHLRGKSVPMDKLAPKLIRRAAKKNYIAIIIDPIYKVITGDENSADQMARFCNQFDKICTELGCAVIYCHHHSKGMQGQKRSMDRASGSGVFARDPDALLDLIELELSEDILKQERNKAICNICADWLDRFGFSEEYSQDDALSESAM
ncbi:MAG: AAA family ATPase, partial [Clostridia bacterium]|nr:AAA family ATPase [Clostridia bacterium]